MRRRSGGRPGRGGRDGIGGGSQCGRELAAQCIGFSERLGETGAELCIRFAGNPQVGECLKREAQRRSRRVLRRVAEVVIPGGEQSDTRGDGSIRELERMDVPLTQLRRPAVTLTEGVVRFEQDEAARTSELRRQVNGCFEREVAFGDERPAHPVQGQGAGRLPLQEVDDPSFEVHGRFARVRCTR